MTTSTALGQQGRASSQQWWMPRATTSSEGSAPDTPKSEAEEILRQALYGVGRDSAAEDLVARVSATLADADTEGIVCDDNMDEYDPEARMIVALASAGRLTALTLWAVFDYMFGPSRFGTKQSTAWRYLLSWIELDFEPDEVAADA